jgi:hypothetical protein
MAQASYQRWTGCRQAFYHRPVAELRRVAHAVTLGLILGALLLRAASGRTPS